MPKVAILGAGSVGTAAALYLLERNIADVCLIDVVNGGLAKGKAADLAAAAKLRGFSARIFGSNQLEQLEHASVIVNCAGVPRKPGLDRMDLLHVNAEIAVTLARGISKLAPESVVVQVANPVDVLVYATLKATGFPRERVLGLAGVLDSARLASFLAEAIGCDPQEVAAIVLGGHGTRMVPILRTATAAGVPVTELLSREAIEKIVERTRNAGSEIVQLLGTGSAFCSVGAAICHTVEPLLGRGTRLLSASVYLDGQYGLANVCVGVPVLIGKGGISRVIEMDLAESERKALADSAVEVRRGIESLTI